MNRQFLYRYETWEHEQDVQLRLVKFVVVAETPCGFWYVPEHLKNYADALPEWCKRFRKWTSNSARVRRCYPTKTEAMTSYKIRASRRVDHLERQLGVARTALKLVNEGDVVTKPSELWFTLE